MTRLCSIKDCDSVHEARGLCQKHYLRMLRHGTTDLLVERNGYSKLPEYDIWVSMKQRCLNPKAEAYKDYGARGIKICDRWVKSFSDFYTDVGSRPTSKHTLDRKNNNGDYSPENCRWTTWQIQNTNRRKKNKNGYVGIQHLDKGWIAWIRLGGKNKYLGYFSSKETAAEAYNQASLEINGSEGYQNVI